MTHNKLASWGHGLEIHFPTIPLPNIEVHFPGGSGVRDMAPPSLGNLGASSLKSDSLILRPTLSKSAIVIFVALGKFYWLPPDKENTFYHPIMYTLILFTPVFA